MVGYILVGLIMFWLGAILATRRQREYWSYDRYVEGYRDGVHGRTLKRNSETWKHTDTNIWTKDITGIRPKLEEYDGP